MNKKVRAGLWLAAILILLAGGFFWKVSQSIDSGSWEPLTGAPNFYTKTDYEGWTTLGYSAHWWQPPQPLLGGFYDFCRENYQVVGYDTENNRCVSLNASAQSMEEAEASLFRSAAEKAQNSSGSF